jgi:hypothetical protein
MNTTATVRSIIAEASRKAAKAGLMALIVAGVTLPLPAQQASSVNPAAPFKLEPATPFVESVASAPQKPGSEGIKVHGHWIMDVKNPDGSIAQHRDFENALVPSGGGTVLAHLLLGTLVPQSFYVSLSGTGKTALLYPSTQSCPPLNPSLTECALTLTQDSLGGTAIVLRGTYSPSAAVTLTTVVTQIGTCPQIAPGPDAVSPATCQATTTGIIPGSGGAGVGIYQFTGATIPDLAIAAGQSLSVSVTISFS